MIPDRYKEIIEILNGREDKSFIEGATEEQISNFEKENKIKLPSQYREWLLFSDGGEFYIPAGPQMYGVAHEPLINTNLDNRPDDTYIVIGVLSFGDPILFKKDSEKIYIYNHEDGTIAEDETYENFYSFLKDLPEIVGDED